MPKHRLFDARRGKTRYMVMGPTGMFHTVDTWRGAMYINNHIENRDVTILEMFLQWRRER